MGHRFVPLSTIQRRMASRDRRLERALAPKIKALKAQRYCPMCELWLPASQTECKACGMPTEPAAR